MVNNFDHTLKWTCETNTQTVWDRDRDARKTIALGYFKTRIIRNHKFKY